MRGLRSACEGGKFNTNRKHGLSVYSLKRQRRFIEATRRLEQNRPSAVGRDAQWNMGGGTMF
jgi:hypothetical protein